MTIAVLCNGSIAVPCVQLLIEKNLLSGIAVPLTFNRFPFQAENLANERRLPFLMVHAQDADTELENWIQEIAPDVVFVMLWPFRISEQLLKIPKLGFFNWHPGLLPQYRGPDPIFWEIRNQEPFGGITVHKMDARLDTGPIAYMDRVPIGERDTYLDHLEKLTGSATRAMKHLLSFLPSEISLIPQDESIAAYQKQPTLLDRTIDWKHQDADSILALIRASDVYGGAVTYFRKAPIHVLNASISTEFPRIPESGSILSKTPFTISCDHRAICLERISAGGQILSESEFCEIYAPKLGERLESPQ